MEPLGDEGVDHALLSSHLPASARRSVATSFLAGLWSALFRSTPPPFPWRAGLKRNGVKKDRRRSWGVVDTEDDAWVNGGRRGWSG